jgi:exonuclease III
MGWRKMEHLQCVATFIKSKWATKCTWYKHPNKRILTSKITISNTQTIVEINLYAPAESSEEVKKKFFNELRNEINRIQHDTVEEQTQIFVVGDFNVILSINDRKANNNNTSLRITTNKTLQNMIHEFKLIDIFRQHHPSKKGYTFSRKNKASNNCQNNSEILTSKPNYYYKARIDLILSNQCH